MAAGSGMFWGFFSAGLLRLFMCDCMNLAVFSFLACGEFPDFMMLLMSSSVRPMLSCSSLAVDWPVAISCPFPLDFSLLCCALFHAVGMGFSPRQMHLVLHAL